MQTIFWDAVEEFLEKLVRCPLCISSASGYHSETLDVPEPRVVPVAEACKPRSTDFVHAQNNIVVEHRQGNIAKLLGCTNQRGLVAGVSDLHFPSDLLLTRGRCASTYSDQTIVQELGWKFEKASRWSCRRSRSGLDRQRCESPRERLKLLWERGSHIAELIAGSTDGNDMLLLPRSVKHQ